jgi:membrane peptidoglycan carboxypeptidase
MGPRNSGVLPWPIVLISFPIFLVFLLLILLGLKDEVHRSLTDRPGELTASSTPPLVVQAATTLFGNGQNPGPPNLIHRVAGMLVPAHAAGHDLLIKRPAVALLLGLRYNKVDLLRYYLNHVKFCRPASPPRNGFSDASRAFFGLPLESLSAGEICILLEMAFQAPVNGSGKNESSILKTRQSLLSRLHSQGILSAQRYREESQRPLSFVEDHIPVR